MHENNPGMGIRPKLAMPNLFSDRKELKQFAEANGFAGIDWSFDADELPASPAAASSWAGAQAGLRPLEVRYHCPFLKVDIGHDDAAERVSAMDMFRGVIRLVSKAGGRFLTIHVGLGHDSTRMLSWEATISNLRQLVQYGLESGVTLCLENLAWGWTSKPNIFEKLVRMSGAGVTLDIGHAFSCEVVQSQLFSVRDFISPHLDRLYNAHIYHEEHEGVGHIPPETGTEIADRLEMLKKTGCNWWVLELKDVDGLLKTKRIVKAFLTQRGEDGPSKAAAGIPRTGV